MSRSALGSLVAIPGFGAVDKILTSNVKASDVLVGAGAGLIGTMGVRWVVNKYLLGKLPEFALKAFPIIGSGITAAGLYMLQKKRNSSRAKAHAFGALAAGSVVVAWDLLKKQFPALSDLVMVPGLQGYDGVLVDNPGQFGLLVDNNTPNGALNGAMGLAMGDGADAP